MKLSTLSIALLAALLTACQAISTRSETAADAVASEKQALPSMPLAPDVLYHLLLGEIAGHRGQLDVSVSALSRAAQKTRDPRLAERATLATLYARLPVDALPNALLWVELKPQSSEAHEALAAALMETGKPAEALQHFEKIIALGGEAGLAQSYLRIAATLGRQSNRTDALETMRVLAGLHPDKAVAQYALAHLAVRVSDLDTATTAIERALSINPAWEDAALFKARVLVSLKDMPRVLKFYESYLDSYPRASNMRLGYARHLVDLKQWDKAREQFKRVVADTPRDAEAMFTIALLALQSNDLDETERFLKRTSTCNRKTIRHAFTLGRWPSSASSMTTPSSGTAASSLPRCTSRHRRDWAWPLPGKVTSIRRAPICTICCPRPKPRKCSWHSPRNRCCATRSSTPRRSTC